MTFRNFSSEDIEPASKAIGYLIINWTLVESVLDVWQTIIFQSANGKSIKNKMGRMLGPKIKFLEENFEKNRLLSPYKEQGLEILGDIKNISDTRHTISHYHLSKIDPDTLTIEFVTLELKSPYTEHLHVVKRLTTRDILDDAIRCERLHPRMIAIANSLLERFAE